MDIVKFASFDDDEIVKVVNGSVVRDITSVTWIERYREASEFTITAPLYANLKKVLPAGTLISHVNSEIVMIVENHEVSDGGEGSDKMMTVTGRGFEIIGEQRVVGGNRFTSMAMIGLPPYQINANYTWNQAVYLMRDHMDPDIVIDPTDWIQGVIFGTTLPSSGPEIQDVRIIEQAGNVYKAVQDLLAIDNLGIRATRDTHVPTAAPVYITVYRGVDRSGQVVFRYDRDELDNADYLWSIKGMATDVICVGKWVQTKVSHGYAGYRKRTVTLDVSDIDSVYDAAPTGTTLTNVIAAMNTRGAQFLAKQKQIALTKPELAKNSNKHVYRRDYFLGDIIAIDGALNEDATQRVIEYVEIDDESGHHEYPTLENV